MVYCLWLEEVVCYFQLRLPWALPLTNEHVIIHNCRRISENLYHTYFTFRIKQFYVKSILICLEFQSYKRTCPSEKLTIYFLKQQLRQCGFFVVVKWNKRKVLKVFWCVETGDDTIVFGTSIFFTKQ